MSSEKDGEKKNIVTQRNNETKEQFLFRKNIFDTVKEDTKDENKALVYSNMWVNILSLGCSYSDVIMEKIKPYEPKPEENVYDLSNFKKLI